MMRFQGKTNTPLSAKGYEQSKLAAARLAQTKASRVISSPLDRAFHTAETIASALKVQTIDIWPELIEEDFGEWEGLSVQKIIHKYGREEFDKWRAAHFNYNVPGGESGAALYSRACAAASKLFSLSDEKIVVVGHGAMLRVLFLAMVGAPLSDVFWHMKLENCSISSAGISAQRKGTLLFLNDTLHLHSAECDPSALPLP